MGVIMWRWVSLKNGLAPTRQHYDEEEGNYEPFYAGRQWGDGEGAGYYCGNRLGGGYLSETMHFPFDFNGGGWNL